MRIKGPETGVRTESAWNTLAQSGGRGHGSKLSLPGWFGTRAPARPPTSIRSASPWGRIVLVMRFLKDEQGQASILPAACRDGVAGIAGDAGHLCQAKRALRPRLDQELPVPLRSASVAPVFSESHSHFGKSYPILIAAARNDRHAPPRFFPQAAPSHPLLCSGTLL